jgi:hypothetical protein
MADEDVLHVAPTGAAPDPDPATESSGVPSTDELTDAQKRANVLRLAFNNDEATYREFCRCIEAAVPDCDRVVLRGSAVTGYRWRDGAPFDSDGAGTSDLDVTLVGAAPLQRYKLTGFFVPGVHSRPLSQRDPEIAPSLIPLREQLMAMVGRSVNIQASRDLVIQFRGDLLGQPYHVLIDQPSEIRP